MSLILIIFKLHVNCLLFIIDYNLKSMKIYKKLEISRILKFIDMGANSVIQRVQLRAPETAPRTRCNDNCQISAIPRVVYSMNIIKGKTSTEHRSNKSTTYNKLCVHVFHANYLQLKRRVFCSDPSVNVDWLIICGIRFSAGNSDLNTRFILFVFILLMAKLFFYNFKVFSFGGDH